MPSFRRMIQLSWATLSFASPIFSDDALRLTLLDRAVISARLGAGSVGQSQRPAAIEKIFQDAGCQPTQQALDKHSYNIVCTLPGHTPGTIVIGGHSDFVNAGQGLIDDWSGTSLLPSLYETLKQQPHKHTFQFVAFTGEERGLLGSAKFVKSLTKEERAATMAFVNLECLGLGATKVWGSRSTPVLVNHLARIASALKLPLASVNVDNVGDDDTHPFADKKIPVISIHSITQETFPILHTAKDNLQAIRADEYYNSYKLIAYYLAFLDMRLGE